MRKIEQQMLQAIKAGRNWQSGNTAVVWASAGPLAPTFARVYLYGSHIASCSVGGKTAMEVRDVVQNWPTATTRSRLRALGINASIRNGKMFIDGKEV